jgi:hypothetical protein
MRHANRTWTWTSSWSSKNVLYMVLEPTFSTNGTHRGSHRRLTLVEASGKLERSLWSQAFTPDTQNASQDGHHRPHSVRGKSLSFMEAVEA